MRSPLLLFGGVLLAQAAAACRSQSQDEIFINEVYAVGPGSDWIELFNATTAAKDIGGYRLYDEPSKKYLVPRDTRVPAGGFLVLYCDGTGQGLSTSFRLASSGEVISLEDVTGSLVDRVRVPQLAEGQSFGRFPDGAKTLTVLGVDTEGAPNRKDAKRVQAAAGGHPLKPKEPVSDQD